MKKPERDAVALPPQLEAARIVSATQAAAYWGVSLPHWRRLYRAGRVPRPIKIGERMRQQQPVHVPNRSHVGRAGTCRQYGRARYSRTAGSRRRFGRPLFPAHNQDALQVRMRRCSTGKGRR